MSVTAADVKAFGGAPFATVDDGRVAQWLTFAAARMDSGVWGVSYNDALIALTLHYLSLDPEIAGSSAGGSAGTVQSMSVGDVSVSYAVPTQAREQGSDLGATFWGRLFLQMRAAIKPFPFIL